MISVVFAETALELVPSEIVRQKQVVLEAKKRKKAAGEMLLDANKHFQAMNALAGKEKRGRPDIAHDLLKFSLDSPLNKQGKIRVFMHCRGDFVLRVDGETRLPRSFNQFCGLMEDVWRKREIKAGGKTLLEVKQQSLDSLFNEIGCVTVVFDPRGKETTLRGLIEKFEGLAGKDGKKDFCLVVGGFPHGDFENASALKDFEHVALKGGELTAPAVLAQALACAQIALE
jgi:rRNA small subunit pseudouridine methyltransferase Nep1